MKVLVVFAPKAACSAELKFFSSISRISMSAGGAFVAARLTCRSGTLRAYSSMTRAIAAVAQGNLTQTVRLDVELKIYNDYCDTALDNFVIQ